MIIEDDYGATVYINAADIQAVRIYKIKVSPFAAPEEDAWIVDAMVRGQAQRPELGTFKTREAAARCLKSLMEADVTYGAVKFEVATKELG